MTEYSVIFTPEAEEQFAELYHYIAEKASPTSALRYTTSIVDFCASMKAFPPEPTVQGGSAESLLLIRIKGRIDDAYRLMELA